MNNAQKLANDYAEWFDDTMCGIDQGLPDFDTEGVFLEVICPEGDTRGNIAYIVDNDNELITVRKDNPDVTFGGHIWVSTYGEEAKADVSGVAWEIFIKNL